MFSTLHRVLHCSESAITNPSIGCQDSLHFAFMVVRFQFLCVTRGKVEASMHTYAAKSQHADALEGYKAYIDFHSSTPKPRISGAWRKSMVEAVEYLLRKHWNSIAPTDVQRILDVAKAKNPKRTAASMAVAPSQEQKPGQPVLSWTWVHYVHQIYGLYRDDAPKSF